MAVLIHKESEKSTTSRSDVRLTRSGCSMPTWLSTLGVQRCLDHNNGYRYGPAGTDPAAAGVDPLLIHGAEPR